MSEILRLKVRSQWAEVILREHDELGRTQDVSLMKVPKGADVVLAATLGEPVSRVHSVIAEDSIAVRSSTG